MCFDLEENEKRCEEIREFNNQLLELFKADMEGLSSKTIRQHLENADFYINGYLLLYEPLTFEQGLSRVFGFLDDYYIRKCGATDYTLKAMAASIKKFYGCMKDHGKISETEYTTLCDEIKESMSR